MNIDEVLNRLDDTIEEAWTLPLSKGRRVVDAEKVQDLIDDIRLNMPGELKQARAIVADRQEIIQSAKQEADGILQKARERAAKLMEENEIAKEAKELSDQLILTSQNNARAIKKNASEYTERVLKIAEEQLIESVNGLRKAMGELRAVQGGSSEEKK